jgi:hypothetical protein
MTGMASYRSRSLEDLRWSCASTYCIGGQSMTNRIDYPRNQTNERTDHGTNIRHQKRHNHPSRQRDGCGICSYRDAGHVVHCRSTTRSTKLLASRSSDSRASESNRQLVKDEGNEASRNWILTDSKNGQDGAFISGPLPFLRRLASANFSSMKIYEALANTVGRILYFSTPYFANRRLTTIANRRHVLLRDTSHRKLVDNFFPVHSLRIAEFRYACQAANRYCLSEYC